MLAQLLADRGRGGGGSSLAVALGRTHLHQLAAAHQQLFQVQDTTFNSRSVDLSGAKLSGSVTLTGGTELPASFELVKESGQWRLTSASSR